MWTAGDGADSVLPRHVLQVGAVGADYPVSFVKLSVLRSHP